MTKRAELQGSTSMELLERESSDRSQDVARAARRRTIAHVVESWGGGVASAVGQYIRSTPEYDHVLIRRVRAGDYKSDSSEQGFAAIYELPQGHLRARRRLRHYVERLRPDVIHAHSSFAGAYVRTLRRQAIEGARIVYTPHCYAFEREDLSPLARMAYRSIERLLAGRTHVVAGCSAREADLARGLSRRASAIFVPNVADRPPTNGDGGLVSPDSDLVAVGRLAPQKDPDFFLQVVEGLSTLDGGVTARWVGGGSDGELVGRLRSGGVDITGWQTRERTLELLQSARVYLHTATWEGFPMTLLEASRFGVPVVARDIPALSGAPRSWVFENADGMAKAVRELLASASLRERNRTEWRSWLEVNTADVQRSRLLEAYRTALA